MTFEDAVESIIMEFINYVAFLSTKKIKCLIHRLKKLSIYYRSHACIQKNSKNLSSEAKTSDVESHAVKLLVSLLLLGTNLITGERKQKHYVITSKLCTLRHIANLSGKVSKQQGKIKTTEYNFLSFCIIYLYTHIQLFIQNFT